MRLLESHESTQDGKPVKHSLFKDLLAGFAAAEVDKLVETHSLRQRGIDPDALKRDAVSNALEMYEAHVAEKGL
ncbi:hypothetical protein HDU83_007419 [Entophlyctis luteolus]|nr:hypothetical protein HDU82_009226 [Entophlyctis luteolus]KAJ3339922.1 hypothetical protein HDU83_007419 [Entophlyctis luteolus]KAJ3377764.1 hypothetical protein HDU84_008247 [Entophlyctis sp. JEL0112]